MLETVKDLAELLILAGMVAILSMLLRMKKQAMLGKITELVQKAEEAINESGMGAEKKAMVIAQLQTAGIKVTDYVSQLIDETVKALNEKGAWLLKSAGEKLGS